MNYVTLGDIEAAARRLEGVAVRTGLYRLDVDLLRAMGFSVPAELPEIWLKAENEQPIGSFKLRGAYNKIASLSAEELQDGVVAHSSGNHAQGVAYAAREMGVRATIVIPEIAPRVKRDATIALGAEVLLCGPTSADRIKMADEVLAERGGVLVPPYDDPLIVAGQGTCGLEIAQDMPEVELILSPVSGGGLLSGIATAAKGLLPAVKVWGAEPVLAGDAKESFDGKRLVEWAGSQTAKTVADGLRTQSLGRLNFEQILKYVDGIVTVTEEEILDATRMLLMATSLVAEPSGAVTLAAVLFHAEELPKVGTVVCVVSGGEYRSGAAGRADGGGGLRRAAIRRWGTRLSQRWLVCGFVV